MIMTSSLLLLASFCFAIAVTLLLYRTDNIPEGPRKDARKAAIKPYVIGGYILTYATLIAAANINESITIPLSESRAIIACEAHKLQLEQAGKNVSWKCN